MPAPQDDDGEVQIALVPSQLPNAIEATLEQEPIATHRSGDGVGQEQL